MIQENCFEEYIGYPAEGFTEADYENGRKLWEFLHRIEPFTQEEQQKARDCAAKAGVYALLCYAKDCGHMDEEILEAVVDFLDSALHDPENGFLLDMIIDYVTDL